MSEHLKKFESDMTQMDADKRKATLAKKIRSMEEMLEDYKKTVHSAEKRRLNFSKWLPALGDVVRPLLPGDFVVVQADTGSGKTAFMQSIAYLCAAPLHTMFFEMELADELLCERFLAMHEEKSPHLIETAIKLKETIQTGAKFDHLRFCTVSSMTLEDIEELVNFQSEQSGIPVCVVMIDYIGLIQGKGSSRYERFSNIAEQMRVLAKRLNVILIASSQVRRESGEASSPVHLHAAKESGSIENSCSLMLSLQLSERDNSGQKMKIIINKNSRGIPGCTLLADFNGETMRVTSEKIVHSKTPYKDS